MVRHLEDVFPAWILRAVIESGCSEQGDRCCAVHAAGHNVPGGAAAATDDRQEHQPHDAEDYADTVSHCVDGFPADG